MRSALARMAYMITIDSRTLALFRVLLGLLIIGDLLARSSTFTYFYTEEGVVPQALAQASRPEGSFSLFFFTTSTPVIAAMFLLHGLIAIQMIVGYRTRIATVISFLFVISLDNHNPLITSHADSLFRLLFFWAMFLPLGERWSVDAIQRERPPRPAITSLATAAILFQMLYMYVVNGSIKTQSEAWRDGTATPRVFGLDDMTYFLANVLREYPSLLQLGGYAWFGMLLASPLLMILPGWPRAVLAGLYAMVHFSFAVTVRIGGFGWVAMAGVFLFLPPAFWDGLARLRQVSGLAGRVANAVPAGLERAGQALAATLPALQIDWRPPRIVMSGAFYGLMIAAIIAVYVVPSPYHLHRYEIVEREPTTLESRIYDATQRYRIAQAHWAVFAPMPRSQATWYVFPAVTADGELLDVYNDRPLSFERPYRELQKQYGNYRERFYMNSSRRAGERGTVNHFLAEYICRQYLDERGIELTHINMWVIEEQITVETITDWESRDVDRRLYYTHGCGDHEAEEIEIPEEMLDGEGA